MTNQIQGAILFEGWSGSAAKDWVYTPWMPVAGDVATFGIEVVSIDSVTLNWDVETRTLESASAASVFDTSPPVAVTGPGVHLDTNDAGTDLKAKELVRYKFNTNTGMANTTDFVVVRALPPSWQRDR